MTPAPANIAEATDNAVEAAEEGGRQRKRGVELEQAIRDAAVAELAAVGYGNLTIESVAARAQTGKASIYRRWPTKQELVFDSVCTLMSSPPMSVAKPEFDEDTSTRDALIGLAQHAAESMTGPTGDAMRAIMAASLRDADFCAAFEDNFHDPRKNLLNQVLLRGVERGEIRADRVSPLLIDILAGALTHRYLLRRQPVDKQELIDLVDGFVMPAIGCAR